MILSIHHLLLGLLLLLMVILPAAASAAFIVPINDNSASSRWRQRRRSYSSPFSALKMSDATAASVIRVALTREEGKNTKLHEALKKKLQDNNKNNIEIYELPCIAHEDGPDYDRLPRVLHDEHWDYVAVTSPEAARVLASAWNFAENDDDGAAAVPAVAAVGKATEKALIGAKIPVTFCPSRATAADLVRELPAAGSGDDGRILYPASAKARETLQKGLLERGFDVTRLDTYDTVTATWDGPQVQASQKVDIVCFASPSAVQGWLKNMNDNSNNPSRGVMAACIGETSASACRKHGWSDDSIFFPEKPGMEGWVNAIQEAIVFARSNSPQTI